MPFLNSRVLDLGLTVLDTEASDLHICSSEPSTFGGVGSTTLGNVSIGAGGIGAPAARVPSGRRVTVAALSGGSVTATGTATHYAIVDTANSRLLAAGALSASQAVSSGNSFSLGSFDIGIPDPA
jgi:hypothetical protein